MIKVFKDNSLNEHFNQEGYNVVSKLLSKEQVKQLSNFYYNHPLENERPFVSTNYSTDKSYRREIFTALDNAIFPQIDKILESYLGVCGAMLQKKARKPSEVGLHIDWQMLEEPEFIGLNVWIPLVDTNRWNGCVKVLPGSHRENLMFRGPNYVIPQMLLSKPIARKYLKAFYLKAGDALIFDNRLLHLSEKNRLFKDRLALSYLMVPKGSQLLHYYFETEGEKVVNVRKYKVDRKFYIEDIIFQPMNGHYALSDGLDSEYENVLAENNQRLKESLEFLDNNFTKKFNPYRYIKSFFK